MDKEKEEEEEEEQLKKTKKRKNTQRGRSVDRPVPIYVRYRTDNVPITHR